MRIVIEVDMDKVKILKTIIERPKSIARSEWIRFWENVQQMTK